MTHQELTLVYEKIKTLCNSYGKTNAGYKALSKMTGVNENSVKECVNELLKTGAINANVETNHFLPHEVSLGWDGSEPHRPQTRYFTLPNGQ